MTRRIRTGESNFPSEGGLLPYAADLGTVGFTATLCFSAVGVAAEFVSPGLVFNLVAPQSLVLLLVGFGALSLLLSERPVGAVRRALFVLVGAGATFAAHLGAGAYFSGMPEAQPMTLAASVTVAVAFVAAARSGGASTEPSGGAKKR